MAMVTGVGLVLDNVKLVGAPMAAPGRSKVPASANNCKLPWPAEPAWLARVKVAEFTVAFCVGRKRSARNTSGAAPPAPGPTEAARLRRPISCETAFRRARSAGVGHDDLVEGQVLSTTNVEADHNAQTIPPGWLGPAGGRPT